MDIRVTTLRYCDRLQGFPEEALQAAARGRDVLSAREHFYIHGGIPHLTIVLELAAEVSSAVQGRRAGARAEDPGKDLPEALQGPYQALRTWRNEQAKADGIPSYTIARNVQLAEICRQQPQTLAALKQIDGIGDGICARYGAAILARVPKPASNPEAIVP